MWRLGCILVSLALGSLASGPAKASEPVAQSERSVEDVRLNVRATDTGAVLEAENLRQVAYELRIENRGSDAGAVTFRVVPPRATIIVLEFEGRSRADRGRRRLRTYKRRIDSSHSWATRRPSLPTRITSIGCPFERERPIA